MKLWSRRQDVWPPGVKKMFSMLSKVFSFSHWLWISLRVRKRGVSSKKYEAMRTLLKVLIRMLCSLSSLLKSKHFVRPDTSWADSVSRISIPAGRFWHTKCKSSCVSIMTEKRTSEVNSFGNGKGGYGLVWKPGPLDAVRTDNVQDFFVNLRD